MTVYTLKQAVVNAFLEYQPLYLQDINPDAMYSDGVKEELIRQIRDKIEGLKVVYPEGLYVKSSKCKYCFPDTPAVSFFAYKNNDFVMRYIVAWNENRQYYAVHICNNIKQEKTEGETPF